MTRFLVSDENPTGFKLEDILIAIRKDILRRCTMIADDHRLEAHQVMANNMRILELITEAITLADESTRVLDKAFGPSLASEGGKPRIGHA